jgi:hypothetical protein
LSSSVFIVIAATGAWRGRRRGIAAIRRIVFLLYRCVLPCHYSLHRRHHHQKLGFWQQSLWIEEETQGRKRRKHVELVLKGADALMISVRLPPLSTTVSREFTSLPSSLLLLPLCIFTAALRKKKESNFWLLFWLLFLLLL